MADGAVVTQKASCSLDNKFDDSNDRLRLLSWNIDGLDGNDVLARTEAVCDIIKREKPTAVYLQEVIPETLTIIKGRCDEYKTLDGDTSDENIRYFTAIMLKEGDVEFERKEIHSFERSRMGRNILSVECRIKGMLFELATSHLESTTDCSDERKRQLKGALKGMKSRYPSRTVIFGGDLNIRDWEIEAIGGIPTDILDLWKEAGQRPEAAFTWDCRKNDTILELSQLRRPPCNRFDRLYLRHPLESPPTVQPVYFELVGTERLQCCQRFPSDHWGILVHFNLSLPVS